MGVCITALALLGYVVVERAGWGDRSPAAYALGIAFLFTVPVGAVVTVLGLMLR